MKFYDRESELQLLETTRQRAETSARMTVIVGRRRIGKTTLVSEAFRETPMLYFFISRKNEALLCEEFAVEIENKLNHRVLGTFTEFAKLFEYLLLLSENRHFTLILDEFQEFFNVNSLVYSEMQNLWDQYKNRSKINLVLSGSIFTLMKKIFENAKEPLFGRTNEKIHLKPFSIITLKEIFEDYRLQNYSANDLLAFYMLTGGVAKYVELFAEKGCFTLELMLNEIFRDNSLLIEEGKNLLIEEFGREYATYFSILSLIASSKTSRSEIESILGKNVGGFLDKLENEYQLIKRIRPIFAKPGSKTMKYFIDDNFLNFWFRFIFKHRTAIEIGNLKYVKDLVLRDFEMYSGQFLEKYFREKLALSGNFSQIGRYWNQKSQFEIDIVAINESENKVLIAEVKRNKNNIRLSHLRTNSKELEDKLSGYEITYAGFSMEDML